MHSDVHYPNLHISNKQGVNNMTRYDKHIKMYKEACKDKPDLSYEIEGWSGDGDTLIFRMSDDSVMTFDGYHERFYTQSCESSKQFDHDADKKAISINLPNMMETTEIDERKLSRLTGISQNDITVYMSGKRRPGYENILKLSKALNCSPADLTIINENNEESED